MHPEASFVERPFFLAGDVRSRGARMMEVPILSKGRAVPRAEDFSAQPPG
jgi:hypothetical protein